MGLATQVTPARWMGVQNQKPSGHTAARLHALIESTQDIIWSVDANFRLVTFNKAFSDEFKHCHGIEAKAGMGPDDLLTPDKAALWPPLYERALKKGTFHVEQLTADGRFLGLTLNPIVEDGKKTGVWVFCKDITEFKATEQSLAVTAEALRTSVARYHVAFLAATDAICINRLSDRTYVDVNQAFLDATGFRRTEVIGRTPQQIGIWAHPNDEETITDLLRQNSKFRNLEIQYRGKNGQTIWGLTSGAVFEIDGVPYVHTAIRDVTDRKRTENELAEYQEKLTAAMEAMTDSVVITDTSGEIINFNKAFATVHGYRNKDECPRYISEFYKVGEILTADGKVAPMEARPTFRALRGETATNVEYKFHRKDTGETRYGSYGFSPIRGMDGSITGSVVVARDITERKAAEEAIKKAEEMFRVIFENTPVGIFHATPEGRTLTVNPASADMMGYESPAEYIATIQNSAHDLFVDPSDRARFVARVEQQGTVRDYQCQFKRKDGSIIWVSSTARKISGPDGKTISYLGFNLDITEKKRLEAALQANNRELELLSEINTALVHAKSEKELLKDCCRIMVEIGGYRMAWVGFADNGPGKPLVTMAHHGCEESFLQSIKWTWAETKPENGPVGRALRTGKVQVAEDIRADPLVPSWRTEVVKQGCRIVIALPFRLTDGATASLAIFGETRQIRSGSERSLMEQIASQLAYGIEALRTELAKTRHQENLRTALEQTIHVIAETVDRRDPYTAGHERRVADLCKRIAEKLSLPEGRAYGLYLAASIHDLGKIGIPAEILSKPGPLTPTQQNLLREHAQLGCDILKDVAFPWPIADIILQHHERLDGTGYPRGLKGDAISLDARILIVADVVEAISSHRPYRAAKGIDAALDEILAQRGKLYDAQVTDACISIFREDGYAFPA